MAEGALGDNRWENDMEHKQRKALARHKAIVKARNIRTNNLKANPRSLFAGKSTSYRLWTL